MEGKFSLDKIANFEDIIKIHKLDRDTLYKIKSRLANAMNMETGEVEFTSLQKDAFNREGFWISDRSSRHIIVQGATSAGKTLVSEMAILDSLKNGNRKSVVLVPLRAMVRERYEQLRKDLQAQGVEQVYPASSDYQEHDGDIIEGNFKVAVIVYEKFFSMLIQSQSRGNGKNIPLLNECALLVVDELQMLTSKDRGPKLEIAIQKVLENNKSATSDLKTRIMCLTTCDCKVDLIEKWLTVDNRTQEGLKPILILNTNRPAGLCEHVIEMNGKFRMHRTYGERENVSSEPEDSEGEIKVPEVTEKSKNAKRNALLKSLLEKVYKENPDAKVLVYVKSRHGTRKLAEFVADENLLPIEEMSEKMLHIRDYDDDIFTNSLREKLLPRRIACHNASLSYPLREFIEDLFCDNEKPIRLIVATETLTIGMNMPVDVMILYDSETYRNEGPVKLTNQEYKNFVGRAGRLGNKSKCVGKSYIFAEDGNDAKYFWDNYVYYRAEDIKSALANALEKEQAPYYLSLLSGKKDYTDEDFAQILKESFAQKCADKQFDGNEISSSLVKSKLLDEDEDFEDEEEDEKKLYTLTDFGNCFAPYALNLDTCDAIRRYFYNGLYVKSKKREIKGLPTSSTANDLDKYALDIFYRLCQTDEMKRVGQLKIPDPNNSRDYSSRDYRKIMVAIEKALKSMVESADEECKLWDGSPIRQMLSGDYQWKKEHEEKGYLFRAILLWYWTKGYEISVIKEKTNFKFSGIQIVQEDISRLAETMAYLLEAISRGLNIARDFQKLSSSDIYRFSTCVNYGMPRNLVIIANKHVSKLDRRSILRIGKLWEKKQAYYESPDELLLMSSGEDLIKLQEIISEDVREELIRKLKDATLHDNLEVLLDTIINESNLSDSISTAIRNIYNTNTVENAENLLSPLKYFFEIDRNDKKYCLQSSEVDPIFKVDAHSAENSYGLSRAYFNDENFLRLSLRNQNFIFIAFNDKEDCFREYEKFNDYCHDEFPNSRVILVFSSELAMQKIKWENDIGTLYDASNKKIIENINMAITFKQFAFLISQAIKIKDLHAHMLMKLLGDTIGKFPQSSLNTLGMMLNNFRVTEAQNNIEKCSELPTIRILCDQRKYSAFNDLLKSLKEHQLSYRIVSWGDTLEEENVEENYYLIYLDWNIVQKMESLRTFCDKLRKTNYKRTFAVFDSETSFREWGGNPNAPCNNLAHCESTKNFKTDIPNMIIPFFKAQREYLVGISYAHASEGVDLLKKFVDKLNREFEEEKIFFDVNTSTQILLNGKGAGIANPRYYKKCQFFLVLDDQAYDGSEPCRKEFQAITERIHELAKIDGSRLWFLHIPKKPHCKYFNEKEDYHTKLTGASLESCANSFIELVKRNRYS